MSSSFYPFRPGPVHPIHEQTWQRLVTLYGYDRAQSIVQGKDPATNADIAAWNNLGTQTKRRLPGIRRISA